MTTELSRRIHAANAAAVLRQQAKRHAEDARRLNDLAATAPSASTRAAYAAAAERATTRTALALDEAHALTRTA